MNNWVTYGLVVVAVLVLFFLLKPSSHQRIVVILESFNNDVDRVRLFYSGQPNAMEIEINSCIIQMKKKLNKEVSWFERKIEIKLTLPTAKQMTVSFNQLTIQAEGETVCIS